MSLLQCDQCKNILKDPIFIPCGYSICKHHIDESTSHTTPCSFCNKVHQDPFVDNQKVSRLLDILNRAKDNTNKLADETQEYERLKQKPNDFVNSRFDELKKQVDQERDRIVEFVRCQVDLEAEKCVSQIEHHRERCLNLLDVKPPSAADFFLDHSDINAKLAKFNEFLVSNKISEDIWDEIYQQTSRMFDQVKKKIAALQESYMARAVYRFESSFDYSKKIPFGRLMIESTKHPKANGTQNGAVSCISVSPPIQREKSPNPMCNNSQPETEVERIVSVSQLQTGSASNQTASGQLIQVRQPIQNTTQISTNTQVQSPQNQLKQTVSSQQIQARQKSPNNQQTGQQNLSKQAVSSQQNQVRLPIQNTTQSSPNNQQQITPQNQVKQTVSNLQIQAKQSIQNTTQTPQNQLKQPASSQQIQARQKSPNNKQQTTPQNQVKQAISNQQIQARQSTQNSPNNQHQTTPQNQLKQAVKLPTQNSANSQTQQQQQSIQTPQKQTSSGQQTPTRQPIQNTSNNQPQTPQQQQQTAAQINNQSLTLPISSTAKTIATPQPLLTTAVQQNGVKFAARKSTNKPPNGSKIDGISAAISRNKSQIEAKRFKRILGHVDYVYCVCFDRTGEYIFTGSDDKLVKMWRAKDGMLVYTLRGHTKEIGDLDINYENTVLASGGNDKKVMCWNMKTAQLIYINTHYQSVSTVKFSPYCQDSTRWLISTGNDGILSFLKYHHNPNSSTSYDFYPPIDFQVYCKIVCSSFSTGGNFLAIGTIDKQIGIYYILKTHPILIAKLPGHNSEVNSIMFSNKSTCFLSGSKDGTVKVWNVKGKKWTSSLIELETGKNQTYCNEAVWNCDDSLVITAQRTSKAGSEHHCIKIWSPSGALKHVLNFHTSLIYIIKPHPTDPKLLLSASQDGYVALWNIFTGQMLFSDYNEIGNEGKHGGICDAKWSPKNAEIFASTDSHGHLSIFGFGPSIPESYSSTPSQLFFHTDYDLMCKERNTIVDKRTKIPPNFMPYGYLTDYMRNPLPLEAQRLVPTHETLKKDEFDKMLVRNPDIEGKFVIDDGLSEIAFQSANLSHKDLIQPLNENLLKESEALRLESAVKEEEFFKAEFNFADLIKDGENNANKRRERVQSSENGTPNKPSIDDLDASSSSLESLSKLANKRKKLCEDELIN